MASGRKDYFRHSVHAHEDKKLVHLIELGGFAAYGRFWALLELCGKEYTQSGERENFTFRESALKRELQQSSKKLRETLHIFVVIQLLRVTEVEKEYKIELPNFSKFIGRYSVEQTPNGVTKTPNKIKEKEKKRNKTAIPVFDLEALYKNYPLKKGRKQGIEKLSKIIKSEQDFQSVLLGIKNYALSKKDSKYVKHFSTFVNQETWLEYQEVAEDDKTKMSEKEFNDQLRKIFDAPMTRENEEMLAYKLKFLEGNDDA